MAMSNEQLGIRNILVLSGLLLVGVFFLGCEPATPISETAAAQTDSLALRVMTYNIEDVRTADLRDPDQPRLKKAAAYIQRLRPDILLINEITYDQPGDPGFVEGETPGQNAARFVEAFLSVSQGEGLEPIQYHTYMPPTNTGEASGLDLDNNGEVITAVPEIPPTNPDGSPGPQTPEGRAYGGDAWGFGMFPGQYGMALFVRDGLDIVEDDIRTFRLLPWQTMPDAQVPVDPATEAPWYDDAEWAAFRVSSKTHMDVPVRLPNGTNVHILASHPTPPAFDGPERRNVLRNAAEIRFWNDYLDQAAYIRDDAGNAAPFDSTASFVILGDLNADPDEGNSTDPIKRWLLTHPRVQGTLDPQADSTGLAAYPNLDPDDTAGWGLRVDYVLPSVNLRVRDTGVWRPVGADTAGVAVSDHFPVWLDIVVPPGR